MLYFYSCGNNSEDKSDSASSTEAKSGDVLNTITETAGTVKNLSRMEEYVKEMQTRINELKTIDPISNDILKQALPDNIDGLKRTSFNVGEMSAINIASGKADYKSDDSDKKLSLEIMDGAGEASSSMASILFLAFQTEKDSESQEGFEKTMDLDGDRALVKETRYDEVKNSEIQWIHKKRFIITLKGNSYSFDELAAIKKKLDLSSLK